MYEFYPHFTNDGSVGLFSAQEDDIYHSTHGALTESWQKFIVPSGIEEYLNHHNEIKILDLCYGIGYNTKTSLQVFVNIFLKNSSKKHTGPSPLLATIDTDNRKNKMRIKNNKNNQNFCIEDAKYISTIDANNVLCGSEKTKRKKILIDAVDLDVNLMNLSPFISIGTEPNIKNKKKLYKSNFNFTSSKVMQIKKLRGNTIVPLPKINKLTNEILIILFEKLNTANHDLLNDEVLNFILTHKKYSPFFSGFMLNFCKVNSNLRGETLKTSKISAFLHNIYYKYLSKSYKNTREILKNNDISLNFYNEDCRSFISSTKNTYNFIFLDAFTPAKCPSLWTIQFFKALYSRLNEDGMILTYSNSAAIRNAFLQCGFSVGKTYDEKLNKFIGTIATKNENLIKYKLDDKDLDLIRSKAGICYEDDNLSLDNKSILQNREYKINCSNLSSSSSILKGYKSDKIKPL